MKSFDPRDLPVREVDYAKQFSLNTKQHCTLKAKIWEEAYKVYKEEWFAEKPNESDKSAFLAATREIEIDSLTFAMSASHEADEAERLSSTRVKVKKVGLASALVGSGPFVLALMSIASPAHLAFWLLLLPYIISTVALTAWKPQVSSGATELRKMASLYLKLVAGARMLRLLSIEIKYGSSIQGELVYLINEKNRLDEKYRPSLKLMENVKPAVKLRLSDEMDPEKLFAEEFDDRLAQAERKL